MKFNIWPKIPDYLRDAILFCFSFEFYVDYAAQRWLSKLTKSALRRIIWNKNPENNKKIYKPVCHPEFLIRC